MPRNNSNKRRKNLKRNKNKQWKESIEKSVERSVSANQATNIAGDDSAECDWPTANLDVIVSSQDASPEESSSDYLRIATFLLIIFVSVICSAISDKEANENVEGGIAMRDVEEDSSRFAVQSIPVSATDPNTDNVVAEKCGSGERCELATAAASETLTVDIDVEDINEIDRFSAHVTNESEKNIDSASDMKVHHSFDDAMPVSSGNNVPMEANDQLSSDANTRTESTSSSAVDHLTSVNGIQCHVSESHVVSAVSTAATDITTCAKSQIPFSPTDQLTNERSELKVDLKKRPISQTDIRDCDAYRVESPKPTVFGRDATIKKCRSLDDEREDLLILELSDSNSSAAENENTPLVSEAESEQDQSDTSGGTERAPKGNALLEVETISLDNRWLPMKMTPIEEHELCDFPAETLNIHMPLVSQPPPPSALLIKREKRGVVQMHFMPQFQNPNYLDAIREENSDLSDSEGKQASNKKIPVRDDSPSTQTVPSTPADVDLMANVHAPSTEIICKEPQCLFPGTKINDGDATAEKQNSWKTTTASYAELIYLDSSSSCASLSDGGDVNSTAAEADVEDLTSDEEVRIATPTIEDVGELSGTSAARGGVQKEPFMKSEEQNEDAEQMVESDGEKSDITACDSIRESVNNPSASSILDESQANVPPPPPLRISSIETDDKPSDIIRQDSSSSRSSHSTSRSQSTARYIPSPVPAEANDSTAIRAQPQNDCRSLRQLCVDQLQSMPYGADILEELANVSETLKHFTKERQLDRTDLSPGGFHAREASTRTQNQPCHPHYQSHNDSYVDQRYYQDQAPTHHYYHSCRNQHHHQHHYQPYQKRTYCNYTAYNPVGTSYPYPDLPYLDDLEVTVPVPVHNRTCPQPPPRTSRQPRTVTLKQNYASESPAPPPVPTRPSLDSWLGPSVLVSFSPAQRQYMQNTHRNLHQYHPPPPHDKLLALQNQLVSRRDYHECTDDEVHEINFKKSASARLQSENEANTKYDNTLLALIREINQITNASEDAATASTVCAVIETSDQATTPLASVDAKQCTEEGGHDKMSRQKYFQTDSDKTFVPIGEQAAAFSTPTTRSTRYSNIETSQFESLERVENDIIVYDVFDSKTEKSRSTEGNVGDVGKQNQQQSIDDMQREFFKGMNSPAFSTFDLQCGNATTTANKNSNASDETKVASSESRQSTASMEFIDKVTNNMPGVKGNERDWITHNRFFLQDFDYTPKYFTDFFGKSAQPDRNDNSDAKAKVKKAGISDEAVGHMEGNGKATTLQESPPNPESSSKLKKEQMVTNIPTVEVAPSVTTPRDDGPSHLTNEKIERLESHRELYTSQQSLRDWLDNVSVPRPTLRAITPSLQQPPRPRSRISPCPIRAPRISDSPIPSIDTVDDAQRRYELYTTRHARRHDNRQSMIDQTPITRHISIDRRRQSLPRALHDKQLNYILEKKEHHNEEYDQFEQHHRRLLKEMEEIQVNNSFEEYFRQNKIRNQYAPRTTSESARFRDRMQEEWLQQVADREERRLHKIIKVTKMAEERRSNNINKPHTRGISDEFIDRVRERRTKLQIPSDSDWESGAESQPTSRERKSPKIDPNVKVVDGGNVADIKRLPHHIKEFAEFTEAAETAEQKSQQREIVHCIRVEGAADSSAKHPPPIAPLSSDGESTAPSSACVLFCPPQPIIGQWNVQ